MPLRTTGWALATLLLAAVPLAAQRRTLPFSQAENVDGAKFVWYVLGRSGFAYPYIPADSFPTSGEFRRVAPDSARAGDVAWWPHFVAIYSGAPDSLLVLVGEQQKITLVMARRGRPEFYRKLVPIDH